MRRVSYVTCIALLALLVGGYSAIAGNKSRVGTAGAQELLIPVGARGIALSGSAVAATSGVDAIFWNPAGLARPSKGVEASFSTMQYIGDIGVSYAGVGIKAGSIGSFGITLKNLSFGDIPITTEDFPDDTGETFSPTFSTVGLSYANQLSDRISVGATFNIITEKIMSTSANGFAVSAGIQYTGLALPGLNLGVVVKNVGSSLTFDGSDLYRHATLTDNPDRPIDYYAIKAAPAEIPTYLEVGLSYQSNFDESNSLTFAGNFQSQNYSDDMFLLGGEYAFQNLVFVRGGYTLGVNQTNDLAGVSPNIFTYTFGVGVKLDVGDSEIKLDYAYKAMKNFDAANVITVAVGF